MENPWTQAPRMTPFAPVLAVVALLIGTGCAAVPSSSKATEHRTSTSTTAQHATVSTALHSTTSSTTEGAIAPSGSGSASGASACRGGNPLANVYHPDRLRVIRPCITVSGTVMSVRHEDDGDYHFDLNVDSPYMNMLTAQNTSQQHGWLVVEIVPADEPGCTPGKPSKPPTGTYDYGICTGANEVAPSVGTHVYVTGPYVLDEDHGGWAEVHPAWAISDSRAIPPTTVTAAPAPTSPPPTTTPPTVTPAGCYPRTSSGNCYEAGEYCPTADHGMAGIAGNGERITCIDNNGWRWEPA